MFAADVRCGARCGGELRLRAVIAAPAVSEQILTHRGRWQRGPPPGRRGVIESRDHEPPDVN